MMKNLLLSKNQKVIIIDKKYMGRIKRFEL